MQFPKLLTLHIVRQILGMTAIVAVAMLAIHSFIGLVADADDVGKGDFGVAQLLVTTALMMPSGLALLMPIVAMIGALMGLGALSAQGELSAMRAAGVTVLQISGATLLAGALLGGLGWFVGDVVAPKGEQWAERIRLESRGEKVQSGRAVWLKDGDHILRIRSLKAADHGTDLEIYTLNPDLTIKQVIAAESANYVDGAWQLQTVKATEIASNGVATTSAAPSMRWQSSITPRLLTLYLLEADAISVRGLQRLIQYLDENQLDARTYRLQLWHRLIAPLTVVAMAIFAVPFAFGSLRGSGAGQRLLIGILLGVGFYVVNRVSLSLGQIYGWHPAFAALAPTVVWASIGFVRIARVR